jgi:DNA-binding transcriptional ArsR family regulator
MDSSHDSSYPNLGLDDGHDTPPPTKRRSHDDPDATQVWRALAPLLAGRPVVRESRNGGRGYPAKWQRPLTDRRPSVPAAIPVYSGAGDTRLLVVDLDTSKGGRDGVRRDAESVRRLVHSVGGQIISDESPSGGIHIYLPFAEPIGFHDARDMALALAARTPTMDPQPMLGLTDGLIRPPGSTHRSGGHQVLHGTLASAHRTATVRNPRHVWTGLREALAGELQMVRTDRTKHNSPTEIADADFAPRTGGARQLPTGYLKIATTGDYNSFRYESPSEARQAVLASAAWAGMRLTDILARIEGGTWPGMASFYARYRYPRTRRKQLLADWQKAISWIQKSDTNNQQMDLVHKSPTSEPPTHARGPNGLARNESRGTPTEYQWLREWWAALSIVEGSRYRGRTAPARRMLLRALGEAGMKSGSRYIEFGTRALDLASGMDHTTVADHLRALRDENDPLVVLVESDRGLRGDLYELRIPESVADRASRQDWRAGKIHALRPAFRELGLPAAFVYEALEQSRRGQRSFDLIGSTGMARSTIYEALETLAAYHLVEQRHGRWTIVVSTSLALLAESLGCADVLLERLNKHRIERQQYRLLLRVLTVTEIGGPDPSCAPPPPDDAESALELLQRVFGARRIA